MQLLVQGCNCRYEYSLREPIVVEKYVLMLTPYMHISFHIHTISIQENVQTKWEDGLLKWWIEKKMFDHFENVTVLALIPSKPKQITNTSIFKKKLYRKQEEFYFLEV